MATERGDKSRREEFRQVARLPVDGIRSDARGDEMKSEDLHH